jgi:hypothetical protein
MPVPPLPVPRWDLVRGPPPLPWVWVGPSWVSSSVLSVNIDAVCNRRSCLAGHLTLPVNVSRFTTAQVARPGCVCQSCPATFVLAVRTGPDICPEPEYSQPIYGDTSSYCRVGAQEQMLPSHAFGTGTSDCLPFKGDRSNLSPTAPGLCTGEMFTTLSGNREKQQIYCMPNTLAHTLCTICRFSSLWQPTQKLARAQKQGSLQKRSF